MRRWPGSSSRASDADAWLAEQGGAPLAALALGARLALDELLRQLAQPGVDGALRAADKLQKTPAAELVGWVQRWLYDLLSLKSAGVVRYYPRYGKELGRLAGGSMHWPCPGTAGHG
jgi:DNA polymerase-3 subunit delta'